MAVVGSGLPLMAGIAAVVLVLLVAVAGVDLVDAIHLCCGVSGSIVCQHRTNCGTCQCDRRVIAAIDRFGQVMTDSAADNTANKYSAGSVAQAIGVGLT